jgi:hypothetical protein
LTWEFGEENTHLCSNELTNQPLICYEYGRSTSLFSYVSIEDWIQVCHPLRRILRLAEQALDRLNPAYVFHDNLAEGTPRPD